MHDDTRWPDPQPPSLREILTRLAGGLVTAVSAPGRSLDGPVTGVTVNDPLLPLPEGTGDVLLGVGVDPCGPGAPAFLEEAGARGFAAVLLLTDRELPAEAVAAARHAGVALLTAARDVPWVHLAAMLRVGISSPPKDDRSGVPWGDVFGFANALARDIGGSVLVADEHSQLLGYSSTQEGVDDPRKETILGRRAPQKYARLVQERGVLRQLVHTDEVIHMEAVPEVGLTRRTAVSVRAAGELLGSIWVAEAGKPLVQGYEELLREAARTAALHLMRHRMDMEAEGSLRSGMIRDLVEGNAADVAAVRLGLDPHARYVVIAFEALSGELPRRQLLDVIVLYCAAFRRVALSVDIGPRVYAVLSGGQMDAGELLRFATEAARRAKSATGVQVLAAVGEPVATAAAIVDSRAVADRVVRALLLGRSDRVVADLHQVRAAADLAEVLDFMRRRRHLGEGPVTALREHGEKGGTLIDTLRAHLDHFGDIPRAAADMRVHPNTFRYRLQRAVEIMDVDLEDPTERLMLQLRLRLYP